MINQPELLDILSSRNTTLWINTLYLFLILANFFFLIKDRKLVKKSNDSYQKVINSIDDLISKDSKDFKAQLEAIVAIKKRYEYWFEKAKRDTKKMLETSDKNKDSDTSDTLVAVPKTRTRTKKALLITSRKRRSDFGIKKGKRVKRPKPNEHSL